MDTTLNMSEGAHSHQESGFDDVDDLVTFCSHLLHHSQWKARRQFLTGSYVEISDFWSIGQHFDVALNELDLDEMTYNNSHYAFNRSWSQVSQQETYTGDIVRIYTDDVHTGYARLIREKDNKEVQLWQRRSLKQGDQWHGPAVMTDFKTLASRQNYTLDNSNSDINVCDYINVAYRDRVYAVHCPYWPEEASEWAKRRRPYGFPSNSLVEQIVKYGCDFVQISHHKQRHGLADTTDIKTLASRQNDCDWRFSFSYAELCIIKNWTISRKIIYSILRVINKRIANSKLCSYYFKTLLFWAWEEKPTKFWSYDLLVESTCELLIMMMMCVKSKVCANYFIPKNNMMDHLNDENLSYEMDSLWKSLQSRELILGMIGACLPRALFLFADATCVIEVPTWIERAFVLYERVENNYDNYADLFNTNLPIYLQDALVVELGDIYRGLSSQQRYMKCSNFSNVHPNFLESESHLLLAVNLCESFERVVIDNRGKEFREILVGNCMSYETDEACPDGNNSVEFNTKSECTNVKPDLLNDYNEQTSLLLEKADDIELLADTCLRKSNKKSRNINIILHRVTKTDIGIDDKVEFYKDWPGRSPTVNISWFIAKAYLANLYCTTQRDYILTIQTCDDIVDVYRQSSMNQEFAERTFPVILSTQWCSIYDTYIQELLGFYSLCTYLLNPSNRSVYLGVCPVQFAFYLKVCAGKYHTSPHWTVREGAYGELARNIDDYNKHSGVCHCDVNVNNGLIALTQALSSRNKKAMNKNKAVFYVIMKLLSRIEKQRYYYYSLP